MVISYNHAVLKPFPLSLDIGAEWFGTMDILGIYLHKVCNFSSKAVANWLS